MTECITDPIAFSSVSHKKTQADSNGGKLTSDARTLLLRDVDRHLGLIDQLNDCIPDPRHQALILHAQRILPAQQIFGLALGYEDLNDYQTLRGDPLFQTTTELGLREDQPLASPPTLCRLENRITRFHVVWPHVRIVFRGDSGLCRRRLMRWCDRHNISYIIDLAPHPALLREAEHWTRRAQERFDLDFPGSA